MNYILWQNGKQEGPYTAEDLGRAIASGSVPGNTLARPESGGDWKPLQELLPCGSGQPVASPASLPPLIVTVSADAAAVMKRYKDALGIADTVVSLGDTLKVLGFIIGGLIALRGLVVLNDSGFAATIWIGSGVAAMLQLYILGSVVASLGQINRACLDIAVNSSPFLDEDLKSRTLQLGARAKAQIVLSR